MTCLKQTLWTVWAVDLVGLVPKFAFGSAGSSLTVERQGL